MKRQPAANGGLRVKNLPAPPKRPAASMPGHKPMAYTKEFRAAYVTSLPPHAIPTQSQRMKAFAIDIVLLHVMAALAVAAMFIARVLPFDLQDKEVRAALTVTTILVIVTYYLSSHLILGVSPSYKVLGMAVVDDDGRPVSLWRSLKRYIGLYYLFANPTGIAQATPDRHQRWGHDRFAGCWVVFGQYVRPADDEEEETAVAKRAPNGNSGR